MSETINSIMKNLEKGNLLQNKQDNSLLFQYLRAKEKGEYGCLQYGSDANGCSAATLIKNSVLIKQALKHLDKPFHSLDREDIINLRDNLKKNIIKAKKWKRKKGSDELEQYETEMSYATKKSLLQALNQFWQWYQEYMFIEHKKEIKNIFERIKLRQPKETEHIIDYLQPDELKKLMKHLDKHEDFKLLVSIFIDTAGRPLEVVNLKRKHFFYENDILYCKLPSIKACSGRKNINEVLYEKSFIESKIKDLDSEDFLFDYIDKNKPLPDSPGCFAWNRKRQTSLTARTRTFTEKITGKRHTPYVFRKTATMHWLRISNNNAVWVQKRLGHVEGSSQIKHYLSLQGVQTPEGIGKKLKDDRYQSVSEEMQTFQEENHSMKLQLEQMQKQMEMMQTQFLNTITQMPNISKEKDVELVRQTIDAVMSKQK